MTLYTKHNSRYRAATFAEYVAGLSESLIASGQTQLAIDIVAKIIAHLDESKVSSKDSLLITNAVVAELQRRG